MQSQRIHDPQENTSCWTESTNDVLWKATPSDPHAHMLCLKGKPEPPDHSSYPQDQITLGWEVSLLTNENKTVTCMDAPSLV